MLLIAVLSLVFFSCSKEEMNESQLNAGLQTQAATKSDKAAPAPGDMSIAAIADEAGFSTLLDVIGLVDEELGTNYGDMFAYSNDQYTVFAPTNAAFDAALAALADNEIEVTPELLETVLLYHVVEGRRAANSVVPKKNPRQIETLLGESFWVTNDLKIMAVGNTANIGPANITASNGIIHVIDAVLLPIEL
ncbi:fasciclin domain-containing protein [Salinimicrobium sp. CAU 1759]